jgi:L-rhamnose mutarotase
MMIFGSFQQIIRFSPEVYTTTAAFLRHRFFTLHNLSLFRCLMHRGTDPFVLYGIIGPAITFLRECLAVNEKIRIFVSVITLTNQNMTEGYKQKEYGQAVKRYCQTLDLKDDPELIAKYKEAHSRYQFWPEIREGIQQVGILEMEIYILGNRLFMIVETPLDFEWDMAMARLATLPRQEEWEDYVAIFQDCKPGSTSDQKWQLMERMFYL